MLGPELIQIIRREDLSFAEVAAIFREVVSGDLFVSACDVLSAIEAPLATDIEKTNGEYILYSLYADHELSMNPFLAHFVAVWKVAKARQTQEKNVVLIGLILSGKGSELAPLTLSKVEVTPSIIFQLQSLDISPYDHTLSVQGRLDIDNESISDMATMDTHSVAGTVTTNFSSSTFGTEATATDEIVGDYFRRASIEELTKAEVENIMNYLQNDTLPLLSLDLSISTLTEMIKFNSILTRLVISILLESPKRTEYALPVGEIYVSRILATLPYLPANLQTLELLNLLITQPAILKNALTAEDASTLVHAFLANATRATESLGLPANAITNEVAIDRAAQARQVQLLCLFIQALLRNNVMNLSEYFYDIQSLCVNFLWVPEAAELFKLAKTVTAEDHEIK
ncbi:CCR4-NOT transcription complex subunit 11 [Neolecta irregularis DAH-3]|uniref:CCR4-NOT transcription complex subunit 11 n=1 Tax=Neolecta irregularis (strain DAH-3) TaxID=1198029 RepID=A0A1U7LKK7_NEOID|nr:CCR4-NOT transcription complex subunit 11 [Neolecta irregularis DAH-3]|eukprot:OLL23190.1 CCR4-NOT transcription complex subunit 11 [Neolecta irregularis DAH-3]